MIEFVETSENDKKLKEMLEELGKLSLSEGIDIFKILKTHNYEIRHSNYLAWLLNPNKDHGLGPEFLRLIFKLANENRTLDNVEDLNQIEVKREFPIENGRKIDILIKYENKNKDNGNIDNFICVIENKYGSEEQNGQCKAYKEYIEREYPNFEKIFIFLDLFEPSEDDLKKKLEGWIPITYKQIINSKKDLLKKFKSKEKADAAFNKKIFKQYIENLNSNYKLSEEEIEKCEDILKFTKNKEKILKSLLYDTHKYNDDKKEIFFAIQTIRNYYRSECMERANKIIDKIKNRLKNIQPIFEPNNDKLEHGNYYIYRFIPKTNGINKDFLNLEVDEGDQQFRPAMFIGISNDLLHGRIINNNKQYSINACIYTAKCKKGQK